LCNFAEQNQEPFLMGKILEYIERSGDGKYLCYKTKKFSLDNTENDTIAYNYDEKTPSMSRKSDFAETNQSRQKVVSMSNLLKNNILPPPIFYYFLDGSRHTYKVDDIVIGNKIFPIVAGQIIVGCCERQDRDTFKKYDIQRRFVISLPDDFDDNGGKETFCRSYCKGLNEELSKMRFVNEQKLQIDKLLLYKTDRIDQGNDKDNYNSRAVAKIQNEMMDEEQLRVAQLCRNNKLNDEHWLIKDGSLEYNARFSNLGPDANNLQANYQHVVGVSKQFAPELMKDYEGNWLSPTIANLQPYERTKVYKYDSSHSDSAFAVWYLRLRGGKKESRTFRETQFSDIIKCEMVLMREGQLIDTDLINDISVNLIREAYPVCFGNDTRWANHLYPVYLTESFCKSHYLDSSVILSLF
jgi:hypothetical protein